jgi:hypothetical protein
VIMGSVPTVYNCVDDSYNDIENPAINYVVQRQSCDPESSMAQCSQHSAPYVVSLNIHGGIRSGDVLTL